MTIDGYGSIKRDGNRNSHVGVLVIFFQCLYQVLPSSLIWTYYFRISVSTLWIGNLWNLLQPHSFKFQPAEVVHSMYSTQVHIPPMEWLFAENSSIFPNTCWQDQLNEFYIPFNFGFHSSREQASCKIECLSRHPLLRSSI